MVHDILKKELRSKGLFSKELHTILTEVLRKYFRHKNLKWREKNKKKYEEYERKRRASPQRKKYMKKYQQTERYRKTRTSEDYRTKRKIRGFLKKSKTKKK